MANSLIMGFDGNSGFTGFVSTSQAYFNINQLGNSGVREMKIIVQTTKGGQFSPGHQRT